MKQRAGARPEHSDDPSTEPFPGDVAIRTLDFDRVWIFEPPAASGAREVHRVVAVLVLADRNRNRLGDVSVLALKERRSSG
jgi:hypothetical protein